MADNINSRFLRETELGEIKTALMSAASHEFNNALSVLKGGVFLLEETTANPSDTVRRIYKMMATNIDYLTMATSNLLNMSRIEAGKFRLNRKKTLARDVIKECERRIVELANEKDISIRLEFPPLPLAVDADPEALTIVITNLLSNAVKYTPAKGHILMGVAMPEGTSSGNGKVLIFCKDTGIGISEADQKKISSDFYRAKNTEKDVKGFGIGLSIARKIIESHGSRLELESEPGEGSVFSFLLPLWKAAEHESGGEMENMT
ncbi:MAG: HAMP domain-containing sensor histidine kinase [bacterium]